MPDQQPNLEEQFSQPSSLERSLSQKPKFNLKYILIVAILAFVVGGGILAYQYWWLPRHETKPPEITIKSWQTYRNDFYDFEFRYPPNNKILECGQNQGTKFPMSNAIFVQRFRPDGGGDNIFGILIPDKEFIKESGEDYVHFITKPGVCGKWGGESELSSETIGMDSYSGKKVTEIFPTEYPNRKTFQILYCIAHPRNPLIIFTPQGSEIGREDEDDNFQLFNQILSTFKFIK